MATKLCPYCAEEIQETARFCRWCKANLAGGPQAQVDPGAFAARQKAPQILKQYESWRASRGGDPPDPMRIGVWTIITFVLTAFLFSIPFWNPPRRQDEQILIAVMASIWTGIPFIILVLYDLFKTMPSKCKDPKKAMKKFLGSLRFNGSRKRAYTCWLAQPDKTATPRMTPAAEKVTEPSMEFGFADRAGFVQYWKRLLSGSVGSARQYTYSVGTVQEIAPGYALADVSIKIARVPTWPLIFVFGGGAGILIGVIIQQAMKSTCSWNFRKLLVERDGRWWVANGEANDAFDLALAEQIRNPARPEIEL